MQPDTPQKEKPNRTIFKRFFSSLLYRPFIKLAALLLAFVFWAVVIASDPSLSVEKTFQNVTVTVQGAETLRNRGFIVLDDLTSTPITVKMKAEVKYSEYDAVTGEQYSPRLDLSQITEAGVQQVKFTASAYSSPGNVLSFEPEYITVSVDVYQTPKRIPVSVDQAGDSLEPIWFSTPVPDPKNVYVSGPKSIVDKIARAVVTLPLGSLSSSRPGDSMTLPIELRDANNKAVSSPLLGITNESIPISSIAVDVDVYPLRLVPISTETAYTGVPAHGYSVGDIRIEPASVLVAASDEVLATLDALHLSTPLDISGSSVNQIAASGLRGLSGLVYVSANEVLLEIDIVPATHVHTYVDLPITVMGLSPEITAALSRSALSVVVSGVYQNVEPLKGEDIHLYVDASALEPGEHTVDVQCRIDGTELFTVELEMSRVRLMLSLSSAEQESISPSNSFY